MKGKFTVWFLLLLASTAMACATPADSLKPVRKYHIKILPVPTFGFAPETRAYVGVVSLMTIQKMQFRTKGPVSTAKAEVNVTQNKQLIFDTGANLWLGRRHFLFIAAGIRKFPEFFWGIGAGTDASARERYDCFRFDSDAYFTASLSPHLPMTGPALSYHVMWNVKTDSSGTLSKKHITGSDGGTSAGVGWVIRQDMRRNPLHPQAGASLLHLQANFYSRLFSGDFDFIRVEADFRQYWKGLRNDVIAFQAYCLFHTGDPPFRMLSLLGSDSHMRGYYQGRFRDRQYMAIQAEYRMNVWKRLGAVAFAGFGDVGHSLAEWGLGGPKFTAGGGLRFLVDKKENINMRLDFAAGKNSTGFYIAFGEAF